MECLFCGIASGSVPAKLISETPKSLAFLDIHPRALGHALVVPKGHYQNILELPTDLIGDFFRDVQLVTELISKTIQPDGFTIGINQNLVAGQEVDHLHVHIIPRFKGDNGGSVQGVVSNHPNDSLDEVMKKIKNLN
jgi:histidine triad (HIT) family protein